jgi:hypothetical protein
LLQNNPAFVAKQPGVCCKTTRRLLQNNMGAAGYAGATLGVNFGGGSGASAFVTFMGLSSRAHFVTSAGSSGGVKCLFVTRTSQYPLSLKRE